MVKETFAFWLMISYATLSVDATSFKWAWILTFSIDASLCKWAFIVTFTSSYTK